MAYNFTGLAGAGAGIAQAQASAASAQTVVASSAGKEMRAINSFNLGIGSAAITSAMGYRDYALPVGCASAAGLYLGYLDKYLPGIFYQYTHAVGGAGLGYFLGPSQGYSPLVSVAGGAAAFAGLAYYLGRGSY